MSDKSDETILVTDEFLEQFIDFNHPELLDERVEFSRPNDRTSFPSYLLGLPEENLAKFKSEENYKDTEYATITPSYTKDQLTSEEEGNRKLRTETILAFKDNLKTWFMVAQLMGGNEVLKEYIEENKYVFLEGDRLTKDDICFTKEMEVFIKNQIEIAKQSCSKVIPFAT